MTADASDSGAIQLRVATDGRVVDFVPRALVMAMFTGRDATAVQMHVAELAAEGISVPDELPYFLELPVGLLTTGPQIKVNSTESSGEVEPVLLCTPDGWYVGVGSDHTARDVERQDLVQSKHACPKVLSTEVFPYQQVADAWDGIVVRSWAGPAGDLYQEGLARDITPVGELVSGVTATGRSTEGLVMFLGTVPLRTGAFVYRDSYRVELTMGPHGPSIGCSYQVNI
jgi:4-hydroxyphenylacetate 3-monooxygenase